MENGDLRTYMEKNKPPRAIQVVWFYQIARALAQVHDKCVLVADVATRNFLLDSDLSIRLCDFSEASVLPLGTAIESADDVGYSIQTDIGQLGAVMYEVITGQKCEFDLFRNNSPDSGQAHWPQRASLPSTDGLWLGPIIEKCWTEEGFQNAQCLSQALGSIDAENISEEIRSSEGYRLPSVSGWSRQWFVMERTIAILALSLSALTIVATWARRRPTS